MNEDYLYKIFQQSIEVKMNTGEMLLPDIAHAASMIVNTLLNDGKILICGDGLSAALAQVFTSNLINRFEIERPSLPAFTLGCNQTSALSIASDNKYSEVFAKEIRALGKEEDVLVVITSSGNGSNLIQAIQSAHERGMNVIILNGQDGGNISSLLDVNDKQLLVPSNSRSRIHEAHLLILFCLCDLIDEQLFGPLEP